MRTVPYCVGCRVDRTLYAAIQRRLRPYVSVSDIIRLALTCYLWEDMRAIMRERESAKKPHSGELRG